MPMNGTGPHAAVAKAKAKAMANPTQAQMEMQREYDRLSKQNALTAERKEVEMSLLNRKIGEVNERRIRDGAGKDHVSPQELQRDKLTDEIKELTTSNASAQQRPCMLPGKAGSCSLFEGERIAILMTGSLRTSLDTAEWRDELGSFMRDLKRRAHSVFAFLFLNLRGAEMREAMAVDGHAAGELSNISGSHA